MTTYNSVNDLVEDIFNKDNPFAKKFKEHGENTKLAKLLKTMRAGAGFSQKEFAEKTGYTQSRISKLESGIDDNITIKNLKQYAFATGNRLNIGFSPADADAVSCIKHHAFKIKQLLDHLVKIAGDDKGINQGVDDFSLELLQNMMTMVTDSMLKLPHSSLRKLFATQEQEDMLMHISAPDIEDSQTDKPQLMQC